MSARFRPWPSSAFVGLIIGAVGDALGKIFLWTLASPQLLVYVLAPIARFFLGPVMAAYLRLSERFLPRAKPSSRH
jgi:hypothetical protein